MYGQDMDSPFALHSTCWELMELKKHPNKTVTDLAIRLSKKEPFPPKFQKATPLQLMQSYADSTASGAASKLKEGVASVSHKTSPAAAPKANKRAAAAAAGPSTSEAGGDGGGGGSKGKKKKKVPFAKPKGRPK